MKRNHKEEFLAFEKEYVTDAYISKSLPKYQNLTQGFLEYENQITSNKKI